MSTHADRPVVVAVADQERAGPALAFAEQEALRLGCGVRLVHVLGTTLLTTPQSLLRQDVPVHVEDLLQPLADRVDARLGGRVPVTWDVLRGPIARTLAETGAHGCMVVLQGEPSGRVERLVTGQVRHGVAARCPAPVVCVPSGWTPAGSAPDGARGLVVLGVDHPEASVELVRLGLQVAAERDSALRVLHAWWYFEPIDDTIFTAESARVRSDQLHQRLRRHLEEMLGGLPEGVDLRVVHQRPADALAEESRRADLLVLGRRDPDLPFGSHLGPVVRAVLRGADCPVMVVEAASRPAESQHEEAS